MRSSHAGAAVIALLISVGAAGACGPSGEDYDRWALDRREYTDSGLPFLSPSNDSRINLQFLIRDAHPETQPGTSPIPAADSTSGLYSTALFSMSDLDAAFKPGVGATSRPPAEGSAEKPSLLADGEGSICRSLEGGKQDFIRAVQAEANLSDAEKTLLADVRSRMSPDCAKTGAANAPLQNPLASDAPASAVAQDFATYLMGADRFYQSDFDHALANFQKLASRPIQSD